MSLGTPTNNASKSQGAGQVLTSTAFTPTANALLLAHFHGQGASAPSVPSVTDTAGLTWTLVSNTGGTFNSTNRCLTVWAIAPDSPSSMTVSADWGASITGSAMRVVEITGANTTTPILTGSTIGTSGSSTTPAPGTAPALTPGNVQMLWVSTRAGSVSPEGGWTELYDDTTGGACTIAAYYNTTGDTSPTATTSSSPWRAGAAEIDVAPASGGEFTINGSRPGRTGRWRRPAAVGV